MVKNNQYNAFRQKIFMMLIVFIMAISMVSAWDLTLNNVKDYNEVTKTVTISDNYLVTKTTIAEASLQSEQMQHVGVGKDILFAWFNVSAKQDYTNFISDMKFIDLNNNQTVSKEVTYKYKQVVNPSYTNCSEVTNKNGTIDKICKTYAEVDNWIPLEKLDVYSGDITIGLFTDTQVGEKIEWIPTMFGVEITEWAGYESDAHGVTLGTCEAQSTLDNGLIFAVAIPKLIIGFTKLAGATPTVGELKLGTGGGAIITCTFVGDVCNFTSPYLLNNNTNYSIATSAGGASHQWCYSATSWGRPLYVGNVTFVNGLADNVEYTRLSQVVSIQLMDNITFADLYPTFTNSAQFPVNNTQYLKNRNYNFNVTILDSNGTAGIEFNGVNYTLQNVTNLYNKTIKDLGAGTYTYYYWAYGNGTSNFFNRSADYSYTINKSALAFTTSVTTPISEGTASDYLGSVTYTDDGCNTTLWRNGVPIDSGASVSDTSVLVPNTYTYNYSVISCGNYTNNEKIDTLVVNELFKDLNVTLINPDNGTQTTNPLVYTNYVINLTNTNITNYTLFVWFSNGTIAYQEGTVGLNSPNNVTENQSFTYLDGTYFWNVYATGIESNNSLISKWAGHNNSFTIDNTNPNGTLYTPANGTYLNYSANINLTANISDNIEINNYTLNVYNQTDLVNQTTWYGGFLQAIVGIPVTLLDNIYTWFYEIRDTANNYFTTENRTVVVDTTYPLISYGTGTEDDFANVTHNNIYINTTWTELNFRNITFRAGSQHQDYFTATYLHNFTGFSDGTYTYNVTICDQGLNCNDTATRTITIDGTKPLVNITNPINNQEFATYSPTMLFGLNFTASDSTSGLQTCWYVNSTGTTYLTCNNNATETLGGGSYSYTFYANDSSGNQNSINRNFSINYISYLLNYTQTAVEVENTTITLNVTATSITTKNATLNYNNTFYNMPVKFSNSTFVSFQIGVITPAIEADTIIKLNATYYINGFVSNTSTESQTLFAITNFTFSSVGNCSTGYSPSLCFTFKDEQNLTSLTASNIAWNFKYGTTNSSLVTLFGSYGSTIYSNQTCICTNTTSIPNYNIGYGEIQYSVTGYTDRRYYSFNNLVLNNVTKNVTLYSLPNAASTSFLFTVQDPQLNAFKDIYLKLNRWYPALDTFLTVEMAKTDDKGQTIMRAKVEDPDYQVGVYYPNGTLIYLAKSQRFACLASPCSYSIAVPSGSNLALNHYLNLQYNLSWSNATQTFNLIFNDPSGDTSNIKLDVFKDTGTQSYLICTTNVSASTGGLSCAVTGWSGKLRAIAYRTASPETPIAMVMVDTLKAAFNGNGGLFISLMLALVLVFIGLASPILMIIMTILALIPIIMFGILDMYVFMVSVVLGGLVIYLMQRSRGVA